MLRNIRIQGVEDSRVQEKRLKILKNENYGRKTTMDYIRMLCISYCSVCELETQILLAGDLDLIEKGELGTTKKT